MNATDNMMRGLAGARDGAGEGRRVIGIAGIARARCAPPIDEGSVKKNKGTLPPDAPPEYSEKDIPKDTPGAPRPGRGRPTR